MFCHHQKGEIVGPRLQSSSFMILMITKHMWLFNINQVQVFKYFQGFKDSRSFLPLTEGVENSRRFKYAIKTQSTQTSLKKSPVEDLVIT